MRVEPSKRAAFIEFDSQRPETDRRSGVKRTVDGSFVVKHASVVRLLLTPSRNRLPPFAMNSRNERVQVSIRHRSTTKTRRAWNRDATAPF